MITVDESYQDLVAGLEPDLIHNVADVDEAQHSDGQDGQQPDESDESEATSDSEFEDPGSLYRTQVWAVEPLRPFTFNK